MALGVRVFSSFVSELESRACSCGVEELAQWAVSSLAEHVGFECAWYGWASLDEGAVDIFANGSLNLPEDYFSFWQTISSQDVLADKIRNAPDSVATYYRSKGQQTDGMITLADRYGLRKFATSMNQRADRKASFYLSSYRAGERARDWTQEELEFLHCAVDQIARALRQCMAYNASEHAGDAIPLYVSTEGVSELGLQQLSEQFEDIGAELQHGILPRHLADLVDRPGRHVLQDRGLVVHCDSGGFGTLRGLRRLCIRRMTRLDALTDREFQVASALADGLSCKEVARELNVAPATVRNQTQAIYDKLGVNNRASLGALIR